MKNKYIKWHFCNIFKNAQIGEGTKIGSYVEIGNKVKIGKNCKIQSFVFIPEGVEIEDNCFIGPGVVFTNDKHPPSRKKYLKTLVKKGASIGANATILPDIEIGENSMVGAGSVITKSIPSNEIWCGNPAKKLKKQ